MKRVPVRYLDRLNTLERKLRMIRHAIEADDPEAAVLLEGIEDRLGGVLMMINRTGAPRDQYRNQAYGK